MDVFSESCDVPRAGTHLDRRGRRVFFIFGVAVLPRSSLSLAVDPDRFSQCGSRFAVVHQLLVERPEVVVVMFRGKSGARGSVHEVELVTKTSL